MEWLFCINWAALVEEAKQRRKALNLTQAALAKLVGVSTPTVSRFENQVTEIQLLSVFKILGQLGMLDKRVLTFPEQTAQYNFEREIVVFAGKDGDKTIPCAISKEALEDHFDNNDKNFVRVFTKHHLRIEHEARRQYLVNKQLANGGIFIGTQDF